MHGIHGITHKYAEYISNCISRMKLSIISFLLLVQIIKLGNGNRCVSGAYLKLKELYLNIINLK